MYDCRSQASVSGERYSVAAMEEANAANESSSPGRRIRREDDFIRGLRSALIYNLAIWAVLLTVGMWLFT